MLGRKSIVVVASVATLMSAAVVTAPLSDAKPKVKPPAKVSKARVSSVTTSAVTISWKNPKSKNFKATIVRINVGTKAPKTIKTGRAAAKVGKNKHAVRLVRLRPNTLYTASIFASGGGKVASKPVVVRVRTKAVPKPKPKPKPTKDTTAPGRVTGLVVAVAEGAAKLTWTNPADKDFRGVKIFRTESAKALIMKRSAAAASETKQVADLPASQKSFTDSTIEAGRSYSYSVVSKDAAGNTSTAAKPASATVTDDPTDPVRNVDAFDDDGYIDVYWERPEDSSHYAGVRVVRKVGTVASSSVSDGDTVFTGTASGRDYFTDKSADAGQTYSYTVFALNGSGIPADGVSASATTDDTPHVISISGTVTAKSGGAKLDGVAVNVFDADGEALDDYNSTASGSYEIRDLEAGTYTVCFDAIGVTGPSATGYASQCADGQNWTPGSDPAPAARKVTVEANGGAVVNAALTPGSAIKGVVTSGSAKVAGAQVTVFSTGDDLDFVTSVDTLANGSYAAVGLPVGKYLVCVDGSQGNGGDAEAGFLSECFDNQPWDPNYQPVEDAQKVTTQSGSAATAGFDLGQAGGIAGTISGEQNSTVQYGQVTLFDDEGDEVRDTETDEDGTYAFIGLPEGTYTVCASANGGDDIPGGLSSQCFDGVAWNEYSDGPPDNATPVEVTTGNRTDNTDVELPQGGAISGRVFAAEDTDQSVYGIVQVFDESGATVAYASPDDDGVYSVSGLRPGTDAYRVCFQPDNYDDSFLSECYSDVAWDGDSAPDQATAVSVTVGETTLDVDGSLEPAATIEGHVSTEDGAPAAAFVYVFDDATGAFVYGGQTGDDDNEGVSGDYRIPGVASGSYHVCFGPLDESTAPQCYNDAPWDYNDVTGEVVSVTAPETKDEVDATLHPAN